MKIILYVLAVLAFLAGFAILGSAKSAIHEIEAFVLYIVSAVLFSGAAIVGSLNRIEEKLATKPQPQSSKSRETIFTNDEKNLDGAKPHVNKQDIGDKPPILKLDDDPARPGITRAQCNSCLKVLTYQVKFSGKSTSCPDCGLAFALP